MDDFVGKPIREAELLNAISRVFSNRPPTGHVNKSTNQPAVTCNLAAALKKLRGDTEFLQQLIEVFLTTVPNQIESLNAAMKARDRDLTSDMAHAIKGTVRYFFADLAYNAAQQLELISRTGATLEINQTYEHLLNELERLRTDLQDASLPRQELAVTSGDR